MRLFSRSRMTPDGTVVWKKRKTGAGTLYLSPTAPEDAGDLLQQPAATTGECVGQGKHAKVYKVGSLVIKEMASLSGEKIGPLALSEQDIKLRARHRSIDAVRFVVTLSEGLARLDDKAALRNGARLTAPTYFGALISPEVSRVLMTYEPGEGVYAGNSAAGTHLERIEVFDAAMQSVGAKPPRLGLYDDIPSTISTNLLARSGHGSPEIVMLDADPLADFAFRALRP